MWGQAALFPVLDHTWSPGTNSWICSLKGNGTLSCTTLVNLIYYLTHCSICCEISSPLTWDKFVDTCLLQEGASHTQFCTEKSHGTVRSSWVWIQTSETSPHRNSQSLRSTWTVSLRVSIWFLLPSQNSGANMLYVISTWYKFCLLVLNQLRSQAIIRSNAGSVQLSSVQFSPSVVSYSLWPHGLQQQASLSINNSRS